MNKYSIVSLGCAKNLVDSEKISRIFVENGFILEPDTKKSDVIFINTCAFLKEAIIEAYQNIKDVIKKQKKSGALIIVAGCLPARKNISELKKDFPEVDYWIAYRELQKIGSILSKYNKNYHEKKEIVQYSFTPIHYAYLKIADGCNHKCSFCAIPSIKGRYKSQSGKDILKEAELLAERGAVELNIIAQDTTFYGKDIYKNYDLIDLMNDLSLIKKIKWIRLLYAYPDMINDNLLDCIRNNSKILHYLDMPLQHSENKILKLMKRSGSKEFYYRLIDKLRSKIPDIALRTTFITGFPGETKKDFKNLMKFVQTVRFERLGVFKYSNEDGTKAYSFEDQVSEKEKNDRYQKLMLLQKSIIHEDNKKLIGKEATVLIDKKLKNSKYKYFSRTYRDAPEIDTGVYLKENNINPGEFHKVVYNRSIDYDMEGKLLF